MRSRALGVAAAVLLALHALALVLASDLPGLYVAASLIVFMDLADFLVRAYFSRVQTRSSAGERRAATSVALEVGRFSPHQMRLHLKPWAFAASVHNLGEGVDAFLAGLDPFRSRLWVVDDASTDDTFDRLQRAGVHAVRATMNRKKPGALRELLAHLPPEVVSVVVLDPDARLLDSRQGGMSDLERVLFEFQRSGMAALCPRLQVRRDGWLASFQEIEYWIAFEVCRRGLADHSIASGIAVYRRDALERTLARHSLSVYAEDLRNTLILLGQGERIYYDGRLVFETEGQRDPGRWFSQRVGWSYGLLLVYVQHFRDVARAAAGRLLFFYQFVVYMGLFCLLFHPLKMLATVLLAVSAANGIDRLLGGHLVPDAPWSRPELFATVYLQYTALTVAWVLAGVAPAHRTRSLLRAPFYVFYALAQVIPASVGYANWLSVRLAGRRLYRDHYAEDAVIARAEARP